MSTPGGRRQNLPASPTRTLPPAGGMRKPPPASPLRPQLPLKASASSSPSRPTAASATAVAYPTSAWRGGAPGAHSQCRRTVAADPIQASSESATSEPYILVKNETDIIMKPPSELHRAPQSYEFAKVYSPSNTEGPTETQSKFFQETCAPMVRGLLEKGQSGLYCTYGVSSSGKSYTVHGGMSSGEGGVLPRTLDTIFNSLQGRLGIQRPIRPKGINGVEDLDIAKSEDAVSCQCSGQGFNPLTLPLLQQKLGRVAPLARQSIEYDHDPTTIEVEPNDRYSVWVSYLEVYNEAVYDLLDVGGDESQPLSRAASKHWSLGSQQRGNGISSHVRTSSAGFSGPAAPRGSVITRHALPLQTDQNAPGDCKYPVGLSEYQVSSATEARTLLSRGEQNRAVFGTLANRMSSRGHGMFTIKIIREHQPSQSAPLSAREPGASARTTVPLYSTARMCIVDLAGSERMASTQLTDSARIKEAGNINKSLMNLGQCIEKIRANQARTASVSSGANRNLGKATVGRVPTPGKNSTTSKEVVPYNSSKLTALLKHFFLGEGSTVMIITANPFDGGFYENAQVMKFSANVQDVTRPRHKSAVLCSPTKLNSASISPSVVRPNSHSPQGLQSPGWCVGNTAAAQRKRNHSATVEVSTTAAISSKARPVASALPATRTTAATVSRSPKKPSETSFTDNVSTLDAGLPSTPQGKGYSEPVGEITIIEDNFSEATEELQDPLVDTLIAKCEELQERLHLSEQRFISFESRIRAEMTNEMDRALQAMRELYEQRLYTEMRLNEQVVDRKLDLLNKLHVQQVEHQEEERLSEAQVRQNEENGHNVAAIQERSGCRPVSHAEAKGTLRQGPEQTMEDIDEAASSLAASTTHKRAAQTCAVGISPVTSPSPKRKSAGADVNTREQTQAQEQESERQETLGHRSDPVSHASSSSPDQFAQLDLDTNTHQCTPFSPVASDRGTHQRSQYTPLTPTPQRRHLPAIVPVVAHLPGDPFLSAAVPRGSNDPRASFGVVCNSSCAELCEGGSRRSDPSVTSSVLPSGLRPSLGAHTSYLTTTTAKEERSIQDQLVSMPSFAMYALNQLTVEQLRPPHMKQHEEDEENAHQQQVRQPPAGEGIQQQQMQQSAEEDIMDERERSRDTKDQESKGATFFSSRVTRASGNFSRILSQSPGGQARQASEGEESRRHILKVSSGKEGRHASEQMSSHQMRGETPEEVEASGCVEKFQEGNALENHDDGVQDHAGDEDQENMGARDTSAQHSGAQASLSLSPVKRRSTRSSTAAKTLAATRRAKSRSSAHTSRGSSSLAASRSSKADSHAMTRTTSTSGAALHSTRPTPAAVEAAASLAGAPHRQQPKQRLRVGSRPRPDPTESRPSKDPLSQAVKKALQARSVLGDARGSALNRPAISHMGRRPIDLSSDTSVVLPDSGTGGRKKRLLRSEAVGEETMAAALHSGEGETF